jgi:MYXO-CTERM domain-containing protein
MKARLVLCAVGALAMGNVARADLADPGSCTIDVGTFINAGVGEVQYSGDFAPFVGVEVVDGANRVDIDLAGLLASVDQVAFAAVRVSDTGGNVYGPTSPGADIDLFTFSGLDDGAGLTYLYEGPSPVHVGETSEELAVRLASIDHQPGLDETEAMQIVSLDMLGVITAQLTEPQGIILTPGVAGSGPMLHLREAGTGEAFHVQVIATAIPGPGALALLGLAALVAGRRRKRS